MRYTTNSAGRTISVSSNVSFQVVGSSEVYVARSNASWGFKYEVGQGDRGSLDEIFPSGSGTTLYVRSVLDSEIEFG